MDAEIFSLSEPAHRPPALSAFSSSPKIGITAKKTTPSIFKIVDKRQASPPAAGSCRKSFRAPARCVRAVEPAAISFVCVPFSML